MASQEARAELAIPSQAAVTGLSMWVDGQPVQGKFGGFAGSYTWSNVSGSSQVSVVDLGRGRVLLKCLAVPAEAELKLKISVTERGKAESATNQTPANAILVCERSRSLKAGVADTTQEANATADTASGEKENPFITAAALLSVPTIKAVPQAMPLLDLLSRTVQKSEPP